MFLSWLSMSVKLLFLTPTPLKSGTQGPFEAHKSQISDWWDRFMPNIIDSWTNRSAGDLNVVTIAELCANRTVANTTGLSGYLYTAGFPNRNWCSGFLTVWLRPQNIASPFLGLQPLFDGVETNVDKPYQSTQFLHLAAIVIFSSLIESLWPDS